jgi:fumarate reductase subunit D
MEWEDQADNTPEMSDDTWWDLFEAGGVIFAMAVLYLVLTLMGSF